jgi:hypothetical protein
VAEREMQWQSRVQVVGIKSGEGVMEGVGKWEDEEWDDGRC